MDIPAKDRRPTVRMFPDYADTVLWFEGPVDYDLTGLTPDLLHDLTAWEQSYYDSLTSDFDWTSEDEARRFTAEGNLLARRVADEIGDGYDVELATYEENAPARRFRGRDPALNARAAAAFAVLAAAAAAEAEEEEVDQAREATRRTEDTGWIAYAPLSGTVFKPPPPGPE
jgi:hypothetical protein